MAETDSVLTLLTREKGKISAIAKGARRPKSKLAASNQLFCHIHCQLAQGRNLDILTQSDMVNAFYPLRQDLTKFAFASYLCELCDAATEERSLVAGLFEALLAGLSGLEKGISPDLAARVFELQLMELSGYGPELESCTLCGSPVPVPQPANLPPGGLGLSPSAGGLVCSRCIEQAVDAARISPGALRAARACKSTSPGRLPPLRLSASIATELDSALRRYVEHKLERRIRSARFLRAFGSRPGRK
jgi:DNA repair protein RecO (recombination protein O)